MLLGILIGLGVAIAMMAIPMAGGFVEGLTAELPPPPRKRRKKADLKKDKGSKNPDSRESGQHESAA